MAVVGSSAIWEVQKSAIHSVTQNYKTWTPDVIDHKEDKVYVHGVQRKRISQENVN